jgi:hypothetical protein
VKTSYKTTEPYARIDNFLQPRFSNQVPIALGTRNPGSFRLILMDTVKNQIYHYNECTGEYWPYKTKILKMTCTQGHTKPEPGCVCGLQLTNSLKWLKRHDITTPMISVPRMLPLVIYCELIGQVIIEDNDLVRAEKIFPKAVVIPFNNWSLIANTVVNFMERTRDFNFSYWYNFTEIKNWFIENWKPYGLDFE